ncbi:MULTISPECIES: hypothetical protein [Paraburkholderia]|uniref:hypothetical protein n=1 Tax=Paraburkholderia TaxID=1822464 RepID=UPI0013A6902A|nr:MULTISPECIES: hypothetical protein [Paraburkholderia]MDH6150774.1 hypothetical protein [Paraburkholderia sp. WSM4179]
MPGFFLNGFTQMFNRASAIFTANSQYAADDSGLFIGARLMTGVIIFVGVWLIVLALLVRFAARIDPRSGRRRGR